MKEWLLCPHCGNGVEKYRNPIPTEDIIIEKEGGVILIIRKNPPYGWALPGGFVDYGESLEAAAVREAKEETSLDVELISQLCAYSDAHRDPRHHTITVVCVAQGSGKPQASVDDLDIASFYACSLPEGLSFVCGRILKDYLG